MADVKQGDRILVTENVYESAGVVRDTEHVVTATLPMGPFVQAMVVGTRERKPGGLWPVPTSAFRILEEEEEV